MGLLFWRDHSTRETTVLGNSGRITAFSPSGTLFRGGDRNRETNLIRVQRSGVQVCEACGEDIRACECNQNRGVSASRDDGFRGERDEGRRGLTDGGFPDGSGSDW